jgi:uncharacterized protein (TIGR02147 family)
MLNLFEFEDYRAFLQEFLGARGKGAKLHLAGIFGCQPGYLSQILSGSAELSPEQAERLTSHLGWDGQTTQYFLLLVARARAGTKGLQSHLQREIDHLRSQSQVLKNRFKPEKVLSIEDQATFYSSWQYGALHVSVSIPGCDTARGLQELFGLPEKRINEILQFLLRAGLVKSSDDGRLSIGSTQVYVGTDSPLISKHHSNWRMRAIESLDRYKEDHLHYSSVISVSRSDLREIREIMAQTIQQIRAIVRDSKDEACYSYALDLFEVGGGG